MIGDIAEKEDCVLQPMASLMSNIPLTTDFPDAYVKTRPARPSRKAAAEAAAEAAAAAAAASAVPMAVVEKFVQHHKDANTSDEDHDMLSSVEAQQTCEISGAEEE
jgi:hypothetical protein